MGFETHKPHGKKHQDEYVSIRKRGSVYFSANAYRNTLDEPEFVEVLIDRENERLGFRPVEEGGENVYRVNAKKVGCRSAVIKVNGGLPDEARRYPIETDEKHEFPYIVLDEELDRSQPTSRPETKESGDDPGDADDDEQDEVESDDEIPNHVVRGPSAGGSVHAPSDDSTLEDPESHCTTKEPKKGWQAKTREQVPIGFYDRCSDCEDRLERMSQQR